MVIVYLLLLIACLVLAYFIAGWFFEVAVAKGYNDKKYFWICFWLGWIGYLLIIALPDRGNIQTTITDLPEL